MRPIFSSAGGASKGRWRQRLLAPSIRVQLTAWYTIMFAAVLALALVLAIGAAKLTLDWRVDMSLHDQARRIAAGVTLQSGVVVVRNVTGALPGLPTSADAVRDSAGHIDDGVLVRVLDRNGALVYSSPAFRGILLPDGSVIAPQAGQTWAHTMRVHGVELCRIYSLPVTDAHGQVYAIVQVGQSLDLVTTIFGVTALALTVVTPVVLLIALAGSYWLAGQAYAPMRRLTRIAHEIGSDASALRQRVPVPRAHDDMRELATTFNDMLARLEMVFAAQRRFIADASHDLRTPVAAILSAAENARDLATPQRPLDALGDIAAQAQRLGTLLNNLLALARADEGRAQIEREPLRIDWLARDVVESLIPLAQTRGVTLTTARLDAVTVSADLAQLLLALMNLVDNALTYTPEGGVVTISVVHGPLQVEVRVNDTGIGIAPDDLPHVFERFYRGDAARRRASGGSGLGLSIVQAVADAHGGGVTVQSAPNTGSTFTLALPITAVDN